MAKIYRKSYLAVNEFSTYSDEEDDIVGQDVNVQQHRVINDDILEEEESESITSVKMATWSIVMQKKYQKMPPESK